MVSENDLAHPQGYNDLYLLSTAVEPVLKSF